MNEHIRIRRLVEGLRSHLKSKDFGDEFRSLIANYNNSCRQLKQRLEQVDAILLSGNISGALKMAETDPSVLDLLTLLGFPESQDLADWCAANGVSCEARFEDAIIHRLNEAYSANHQTDAQLEKDYRRAILKKDYASALPIARTMARLQPDDNGAQTELRNMERRYAKQLENKLDVVVHGGDADAAKRLLQQFDNLRCEDYSGGEVIRRARLVVQNKNNEDGLKKISKLIEQAPSDPGIEDWETFEALYDTVLGIKSCLTVELPPDLYVQWQTFSQREAAFRQKVTRINAQRIALEKLKSVIDNAQTIRITGQQLDLSKAQATLDSLLSSARNAESLEADISDELQSSWHDEVTDLRNQVACLQKTDRRKKLVVGVVSFSVFAAVGVVAYFYAQSTKVVSEADAILAGKELSRARAFVNAEYPEGWLLKHSQKVRGYHAQVRDFIKNDEASATVLKFKVESFEATKEDWSKEVRQIVIANGELKTLFAGLDLLSDESGRPIRMELDRLGNELAIVQNAFAADLIEAAEVKISEIEDTLLAQVSLSNSPDQLSNGVEVISKVISQVRVIDSSGQGIISISQDQELRLTSILQARDNALSALKAHNDLLDNLTHASDVEGFFAILKEGLDVEYPGSPFFKDLVKMPKTFDESAFRKTVFSDLPKEFRQLIGAGSLSPLSPPSALLTQEVDAYAEFRFNEMVDGIQFHELVIPNPVRDVRIYSRGEVSQEGSFSTGDYIRSFISGRFYFPHIYKGVIQFVDYDSMMVSDFTSYGDLPEFKMFETLKVDDLLSSQREVISNPSNPAPIMRLIDKIRSSPAISVDFKCFAIIQLFDVMNASDRSEQWGSAYLPNWQEEVEKLESVGVQNGDWLKENSSRKAFEASKALSDFFNGLAIEDLAKVNREFLGRIIEAKIDYIGFLNPHVEAGLDAYVNEDYYALSASNRQWVPITSASSISQYVPFSPVLSMSSTIANTYAEVCEDMDIDLLQCSKMALLSGLSINK